MHQGSRNSKDEYTMDGTNLATVTEEQDFGVHIDEELKFHKHVSSAVSNANQTQGIVKRIFDT